MRRPAPIKPSGSCSIAMYHDHQEHICTYTTHKWTQKSNKNCLQFYNSHICISHTHTHTHTHTPHTDKHTHIHIHTHTHTHTHAHTHTYAYTPTTWQAIKHEATKYKQFVGVCWGNIRTQIEVKCLTATEYCTVQLTITMVQHCRGRTMLNGVATSCRNNHCRTTHVHTQTHIHLCIHHHNSASIKAAWTQ